MKLKYILLVICLAAASVVWFAFDKKKEKAQKTEFVYAILRVQENARVSKPNEFLITLTFDGKTTKETLVAQIGDIPFDYSVIEKKLSELYGKGYELIDYDEFVRVQDSPIKTFILKNKKID